MTMMDVIALLKDMNMDVQYTKRKDGGVRVTKIGNQRFTGSTGNAVARDMVGATLSERRVAQLKTIKTPKGKWGHKKTTEKLDEETIKRIRRVQRKMRKTGVNRTGAVTQRNYKWILKHEGKAEADRRLTQAERYVSGLAYVENVDALVSRLKLDNKKLKNKDIEEAIELIKAKRETMKESQLSALIESTYFWEKTAKIDKSASASFLQRTKTILKD